MAVFSRRTCIIRLIAEEVPFAHRTRGRPTNAHNIARVQSSRITFVGRLGDGSEEQPVEYQGESQGSHHGRHGEHR